MAKSKLVIKSFDTQLDEFEAGGKKQQERALLKLNKKKQINSKVSNLETQLEQKRLDFQKSLTETGMDTIQIGIDVKIIEKELEFALEVQTALFA